MCLVFYAFKREWYIIIWPVHKLFNPTIVDYCLSKFVTVKVYYYSVSNAGKLNHIEREWSIYLAKGNYVKILENGDLIK